MNIIPDGWRIVTRSEKLMKGDKFLNHSKLELGIVEFAEVDEEDLEYDYRFFTLRIRKISEKDVKKSNG